MLPFSDIFIPYRGNAYTFQCTMKSYRFDVTDGSISNEHVFVQFDKWLDGAPDGQCNDADGNLWVAMFGVGRLIKVDGETGILY